VKQEIAGQNQSIRKKHRRYSVKLLYCTFDELLAETDIIAANRWREQRFSEQLSEDLSQ
jgi:hypothetical protein